MDEQQKHPVTVTAEIPERSSRLYALFLILFAFPKLIILIPHLIILSLLGIASFFGVVLAQFAILFTGKFPQGLFHFIVGVLRWQIRVNAFLYGITDRYPPFKLD